MNIYEFIGIIIGDGSILYSKEKRYCRLEIAGSKDDIEFFDKINNFILKNFNLKPKIRDIKTKNNMGLRLYIDNKRFVEFLIYELGLPYGNKTFTVKIPEHYTSWKHSKHILRGIFESDGFLFFSKSKSSFYPTYPRIGIKTVSKELAFQIQDILRKNGFKAQIFKSKLYNPYTTYISGRSLVKKWYEEIGFSNPKNLSKYLFWKKYGYHIPRISFKKRLELLNSVGQWPSGKAVDT